MTRSKKRRLQRKRAKMRLTCNDDLTYYFTEPTAVTFQSCEITMTKEETETDMRTETQEMRDHLIGRLMTTWPKRQREMERAYGLLDDKEPQTGSEFVKRIKDGKYTIERCSWDETQDYIRWRDPEIKEDREGYQEAYKALSAEYDTAKDNIMVKSPEDGLAILQAFESNTIN